ncbi:MAG TPA: putative lipid II flippase FtsW [Noviherbaspirillum sp.]|nr:putative lipid II flippase FtsW [Noviherbaspirillum sp.]
MSKVPPMRQFRIYLSRITSPARPRVERIDEALLWAATALLALGLVMVYSASIALPDAPKYAAYRPDHFLLRQFVGILVAAVIALVTFCIPMARWEQCAGRLLLAALVALVLVLLPGVGKGINGAHRWIALGVVHLQPSEFAKLAMVLYVSSFATRRTAVLHSLTKGFGPVALTLLLVGILLLLEPDMGAFCVIAAIAMGVLFVGGVNAIWFGSLSALLAAIFSVLIATSPWRRQRFFAYLDPWGGDHALGKAYQLSHSLIAFGRGELFGVGLGASVEKLHYLPEAHTDFLLAVIGEELGFAGVAVVIGLFYFIVKRCFCIGRQAALLDASFSGLVAHGVGIWLGTQAIINMGVNVGLLPTKGLTLPLMSYGGSGMIANGIALALVLRVDVENRRRMQVRRS